jgi:hypothetical protein
MMPGSQWKGHHQVIDLFSLLRHASMLDFCGLPKFPRLQVLDMELGIFDLKYLVSTDNKIQKLTLNSVHVVFYENDQQYSNLQSTLQTLKLYSCDIQLSTLRRIITVFGRLHQIEMDTKIIKDENLDKQEWVDIFYRYPSLENLRRYRYGSYYSINC